MTERRSHSRIRVTELQIVRAIRRVAAQTGVDPKDIRSQSMILEIKDARWMVWQELAKPGVSVASIARLWPCHWTTILHACGRVKSKVKQCA